MSKLIADKENKRFVANTMDMTQDDYFVIAILEMCTDPELSKRIREVKANELTWEKFKDVAEVYKRATASDNKAIMVNSNKKNWKRNQNRPPPTRAEKSSAGGATKKGTTQMNAGQININSTANSAGLKGMYPKPARKKRNGETARPDLILTRIE